MASNSAATKPFCPGGLTVCVVVAVLSTSCSLRFVTARSFGAQVGDTLTNHGEKVVEVDRSLSLGEDSTPDAAGLSIFPAPDEVAAGESRTSASAETSPEKCPGMAPSGFTKMLHWGICEVQKSYQSSFCTQRTVFGQVQQNRYDAALEESGIGGGVPTGETLTEKICSTNFNYLSPCSSGELGNDPSLEVIKFVKTVKKVQSTLCDEKDGLFNKLIAMLKCLNRRLPLFKKKHFKHLVMNAKNVICSASGNFTKIFSEVPCAPVPPVKVCSPCDEPNKGYAPADVQMGSGNAAALETWRTAKALSFNCSASDLGSTAMFVKRQMMDIEEFLRQFMQKNHELLFGNDDASSACSAPAERCLWQSQLTASTTQTSTTSKPFQAPELSSSHADRS